MVAEDGFEPPTSRLWAEQEDPEIKDLGVLVEQYDASDGVQIIIKYWIPYNKFLMSREKEKGSKYAHFSIVCKQYYENSKTLLTKKTITDRYIEIEI